jgi:hypothetical protein
MFGAANTYEVARRRELLMAAAKPRRNVITLRQRVGLKLVRLGLVVAGRLTVSAVTDLGRAAPQT